MRFLRGKSGRRIRGNLISQRDLSIVHQMLLKRRAKPEASQMAMEDAQARMQAEQENAKGTKAQVDELLSWAQCFDKADIGTRHLFVSRLIERVDVRTGTRCISNSKFH